MNLNSGYKLDSFFNNVQLYHWHCKQTLHNFYNLFYTNTLC